LCRPVNIIPTLIEKMRHSVLVLGTGKEKLM